MLSKQFEDFLSLVCLGIGNPSCSLSIDVDWQAIEALAQKHGLTAVMLDGIERLPEEKRPSKELTLQWIGDVLHNYEQRYVHYCHTIAELANLYNRHGYKMMVLKGYACSLDWPKPSHRPCGDIDIWQFGEQMFCDIILSTEKEIDVDHSHHHHTVFYWQDFMVENHYDFLNIHHHKSNVELEAILKQLGQDDSHYVELYDERVYLPSANLHALFLLRHSMSNFASTGMLLRQLLDWAFFVEKHNKEIDWKWLEHVLEQYGMIPAYSIFNAICVEDLGFDSRLFPKTQINPELKNRVLCDILEPEYSELEKGGLISRAAYKYRRWKANKWKHNLCFSDSLWSAFWSGVISHILKPSSI